MNYTKRLFLTLLLLFSVAVVYAGGIKSATDLVAFATALSKGEDISTWRNDKGVVCLEADIDMAKVKKFPTIQKFGGVLDGQGFALRNWKAQNALIHELLEGGKVCNLRIDASCSMKAQTKGGDYKLGWIANINSGTIQNCENHAPISHKANYTEENITIGGLVGLNRYVVIDSRNHAPISSECVACGDQVIVRIGGVIGGSYEKEVPCATVVRCENYGEVKYAGDAQTSRVAGVIGEALVVIVKFCVNRGNVYTVASTAAGRKPGLAQTAGITAFSKRDIICCDNFGEINSTGSPQGQVAGIVGMPHRKLVIADCTNYGKVECSNETPSMLGGIVANVGREVHIVNGVNRGHIYFCGSSPDNATCVGGIVGTIYTTKSAKFNVYLRNCNNFGMVESMSGGNHYENHPRAIHTGGIVGRSAGSPLTQVRILDCSNRGEVKALSGRRGNIAGVISETKVTGAWFDNNYAVAVEPMNDGSTLYGRITDTEGTPLSGVVVSDGVSCVATDGFGYYALKSDMTKSRFVFISVPSGYKVASRSSIPQIFRRVPRYAKAATANFMLEKRTESADKHTVIMIGDPQMRGLGLDESGERLRDVVMPDIEEYRKSCQGEFFAINLGDLVYNWMAGYDDYLDICATASYPIFNVIGNHDYDQFNILETKLGTPYFEEYITPTYYSFNIGKIHYVMVNNIVYDRADHTKRYRAGLEDEQLKWLEQDLKYVPKDHTIVVCGHAQLYKRAGETDFAYGRKHVNYNKYIKLFAPFKRVYSWSGHYHTNYGFDYAGKPGLEELANVTCVTVARCNGVLRSNKELSNDGTTNGYMVVEVDGDNIEWYYKTVGKQRDYQMRVYSPTRTEDGYVKATIWNHTIGYWGTPEWWENGVKVADMEHHPEFDIAYLDIHKTLSHLRGTAAKYAKPAKSRYMFRVKPSEGVRSGEVRVKDNFGVTYTQKVEW